MSAIQVIDYGAGNLRSVVAALRRLGASCRVVAAAHDFDASLPVLLPGVGAAGSAMQGLARAGLVAPLRASTAPILGICLGMQLFGASSEENDVATLGLISGRTQRLQGVPKIPHMGWNQVRQCRPTPLFAQIPDGAYFYFAHMYVLHAEPKDVIATTSFNAVDEPRTTNHEPPAIAIQRGNVHGVQFHPEKSGDVGMQLLKNFCTEANVL